jgi:hypothetical protein
LKILKPAPRVRRGDVAELVDALRSGRSGLLLVKVQVLSSPPRVWMQCKAKARNGLYCICNTVQEYHSFQRSNAPKMLAVLVALPLASQHGAEVVMGKVAQYLQEHLLGEVTDSTEARKHFSQDASILRIAPAIVVYPRDENDIAKPCVFLGSWPSADVLVFTAHMNRILELDQKKQFVTVEPGVTYDKLEQTLHTHGLFLPPYPASLHYATIGGGLANNDWRKIR